MKAATEGEPPQRRPLVLVTAAMEPGARPDVADALETRAWVRGALEKAGWATADGDITPSLVEAPFKVGEYLRSSGASCVFNLFEGFGADSQSEHRFRSMVEAEGIPCTGNSAVVLKTCLSKGKTYSILRERGILVPRGVNLYEGAKGDLLDGLPMPIFLKPLFEDGSVGIDGESLVTDRNALGRAVAKKLRQFPKGIRAEEFLPGKEYSVSCLGNSPFTPLGVSVVDYRVGNGWLPYLDYGSKWDPSSPMYSLTPLPAEGAERKKAERIAAEGGKALGCTGYFRVDLREKDGKLHVIDINPNPDMGAEGGFLRQCREGGLERDEVPVRIVELAMEHGRRGSISW